MATNHIDLELWNKRLLTIYSSKEELLISLDELMYMLNFVNRDCFSDLQIHNYAFTIRTLQKALQPDLYPELVNEI